MDILTKKHLRTLIYASTYVNGIDSTEKKNSTMEKKNSLKLLVNFTKKQGL